MEGSIRKQRQETIYKQRERRRKFIEIAAIIIAVITGVGALVMLVMWLKSLT